jgi:uncharacterized membrane protein
MTQMLVRDETQDEARTDEEPGLIAGRPVEDRSFEVVEASVGLFAGAAIGAAVAGPIGGVVGGLIGLTGGITAGEAVERVVGRAATTTDATGPDPQGPR